jgi:hypothetical protein
MDGRAEIFKENNAAQNRTSLAEMPVTEFRVRRFKALCHLSEEKKLPLLRPRVPAGGHSGQRDGPVRG